MALLVQPNPADGELEVGESARVRDLESGELVEYRILGAGEADPAAGSISYVSPAGSAPFGRRVGDVIEVPPLRRRAFGRSSEGHVLLAWSGAMVRAMGTDPHLVRFSFDDAPLRESDPPELWAGHRRV